MLRLGAYFRGGVKMACLGREKLMGANFALWANFL